MRSERSQYIFPLTDTLGVAQAEWPSAELLQVALFNPFVMSNATPADTCRGSVGMWIDWKEESEEEEEEEDRGEGGRGCEDPCKGWRVLCSDSDSTYDCTSCTAVGFH